MDSSQSLIRRKFEYLTVYVKESGEYQTRTGLWRSLNELGEEGWELVSVVQDASDLLAFLKRPR